MRLEKIHIVSRFKNLFNIEFDFTDKKGMSVLIGNNGSGKSNIIEAFSSIFAGLYNNRYNPHFSYIMKYTKDTYKVEIEYDGYTYLIKVNNIFENLKREHLPSQIISSYSGEESRLWNSYYEPFYKDYIRSLRGATLPSSDLIYINKYYWSIALLTFYFYDFNAFTDIRDFCKNTLCINSFNYVIFKFDVTKIKSWPTNPVVNFVKAINPHEESSVQLDLRALKDRLAFISREIDFFRYLAAAYMPKDDKLITDIEVNINNDLKADSLSEGEKKLLLTKLILEVVGDESALILLDEPDAHIHVSRKRDLKALLSQYTNRENIITTHSPTLTHCFDIEHIIMLTKNSNDDVQIESKEKQAIIHELTNGVWSYQEQNIFLNSKNDILLVEGKSDETFISHALAVFKRKNKYLNLNFEYLPCGGADGVKLLINKFKPKPGQYIIAFFDRDKAGWGAINKIFNRSDNNKYTSNNFGDYKKIGEMFIAVYPIRSYYRGGANFNIEDYFSKKTLNKYALATFKGLHSLVSKDTFKSSIEKDCNTFPDEEFKHFRSIFDLISLIKTTNHL